MFIIKLDELSFFKVSKISTASLRSRIQDLESRAILSGRGQPGLIETFESTGVSNKMKKDKNSGDLSVNGVRGGHFDCLNYVFQVTGNDR